MKDRGFIMFIGRKQELASLNKLLEKDTASLVVLKGRRRVGKSKLIEEFAKKTHFIRISGYAPNKDTTAQNQRDTFGSQLSKYIGLPNMTSTDWTDLFILLAKSIPTKKKVTVLLDEISWLGSKDKGFTAKLKDAWDYHFSKHNNLILVLCGSVSSWIEKEIIQSTAFLGRPTLNMNLKELSLNESNEFWQRKSHSHISAFEKLKILSLTGGIPRYLELINVRETAEENIKRLSFYPDSPLIDEFKNIFSDIFGKRSTIYKSIIKALLQGPIEQATLLECINRKKSGQISEYLDELELAGFIRRDYVWSIKNKKQTRLSKYRIKDNYLRFYLKYIDQNIQSIKDGLFLEKSLESFSGWNTMLGLQFECLVQNNMLKITELLKINPNDLEACGPYFQKNTARKPGCQIDLMIQTKQNILYVCEIKFNRNPIGMNLINEVKTKINNLIIPRNYTCLPVLVHVNNITDELYDEKYFYKTIDFCELL